MPQSVLDIVNAYHAESETTPSETSSTLKDSVECSSLAEKDAYCVQTGAEHAWVVADQPPENISTECPPNSMPWRMQSVCSAKDQVMCYKTELESSDGTRTDGGICVVSKDETPKVTDHGDFMVQHPMLISNDAKIQTNETQTMTACYIQPFAGLENSTMVVYASAGDSCDALRSDAINACKLANNDDEHCEQKVKNLYEPKGELLFSTHIQTQKIPYLNVNKQEHLSKYDYYPSCNYDPIMKRYVKPENINGRPTCPDESNVSHQWWRWKRVNEYACKDGWNCDDEDMTYYAGGESCRVSEDCDVAEEFGVCNMQSLTCLGGTKDGETCSSHNECDIHDNVRGKCAKTGVCTQGKTGLQAAYYKPVSCSPPSEGESKRTYCGKITLDGETKYTGYCEAYRMKDSSEDSYACKAFMSGEEGDDEILEKQFDERDYQIGFKRENFESGALFPWNQLSTCPETYVKIIDGVQVCTATHEKVDISNSFVNADTREEAIRKKTEELCLDTFGKCAFDDIVGATPM